MQAWAQDNQLPTNIYSYDIIYMRDGRVLKGEILIFQESDGDITFIDTEGRKYSITREEYKYFKENIRYKMSDRNDTIIIRERKDKKMAVRAGILPLHFLIPDHGTGHIDIVAFNGGIGYHFTREHYLGAYFEFNLFNSTLSKYFATGLEYNFQYDAYKRNTAFYLITQAKYALGSMIDNEVNIQIIDTLTGSTTYFFSGPVYKTSSIGFTIGQGFAFMLRNRRSINLELLVGRQWILNKEWEEYPFTLPAIDSKIIHTVGLRFFFNL